MAMVPYKNKQLTRQKKAGLGAYNTNQLVSELGLGRSTNMMAAKAVQGIVSAFQNRGASRQEVSALVAPLAKSLTYTSRKPKFTTAVGGLSIEHIENIPLQYDGHARFVFDSNLFTWLKGIANQFEEYQIKTWLAWNPICPATTTGQVLMAFDYDPSDEVVGEYIHATDYFNTADHCISAIWAPCTLSPQKSGWLKTGNTGDPRLYSPGAFHFSTTDRGAGFLTVKYQVSLRKPQPGTAETEAAFFGTFSTDTGIFANASVVGGNSVLIAAITDNTLTIRSTPGYKLVVWSTDATVASISTGNTDARAIGVRQGSGASFISLVAPGVTGLIGAVLTTPSGATSYKVSVIQLDFNPLYFTF